MLKELDEQIKKIYDEIEVLQSKVKKLNEKRDKIVNDADKEIIATIPEDIYKISNGQWEWILKKEWSESMAHHSLAEKIFKKLGFSTSGYWKDTEQPIFVISNYGLNSKKIKAGFKLIEKHLTPILVKDRTTELGISFLVYGLDENCTSVIYVHKDGTVALYVSRWSDAEEFKSFYAFIDWYEEELNKHEIDD